ncbi:hypothetical protein FRC01_004486 [Tulasnella sp. 417]|nr:hypothetical protein FRC01_004486 [Tulasnella sp. 417]
MLDVTSVAQLDKLLSANGSKLTVIDFHATWCGPCHAIAPKYAELAKEFTGVQFLKCDVYVNAALYAAIVPMTNQRSVRSDAAGDVSKKYSVAAMPTFVFIKDGQKVDQVRGANPSALEATIRKHAGAGSGAFSGKGQTLGGDSGPSDGTPEVSAGLDPQMTLLLGLLGLYGLYWWFNKA